MPNNTNSLTFGAELECYLPTGATMQGAAQAVAMRIGRPVNVEGYNHALRPTWKVVTDGSLGDYSRGCEFVSPKLSGEEGLAELETVCEALTDFGCTVNKSCGMHVHVGVAGQSLRFFKKLVRLYQSYETIIDTLMPASRRLSANSFCRSISATPAANVEAANSREELAVTIRRHSGASENRYHKLNLAAYDRHSTVEFRQHSGTLDASKARNWVVFCLNMVETAKRETLSFGSASAATTRNTARRGTKAHQIGEMLLREQGASGPEICAAMGWPSVSVPAQARAAGLDVYSQRTGRAVRYYVRRTASVEATTALDVTLNGFGELLELPTTVREFYTRRANNLRGPVAWAA